MNKNRYLFKKGIIIFFIMAGFLCHNIIGQETNRIIQLDKKLNQLTEIIPALNTAVDISVNGVSIQEFIRAIAFDVNLNINVAPEINISVINNFTQVKTKDVLLFLCKEYSLDITNLGSILSVIKYSPPEVKKPPPPIRVPGIKYNESYDLLSLELFNDTLSAVTRMITDKTKNNFIISSGIENQIVSVYIKDMPFDNTLEKFAFANGLAITKTEDDFYMISKSDLKDVPVAKNKKSKSTKRTTSGESISNLQQNEFSSELVIENGEITLYAIDEPLYGIIKTISDELNKSYFILSDIEGNIEINFEKLSYEKMLETLLFGTKYTYKKQKDIFLIGEVDNPALQDSRVVQLQNRTVEGISEIIPEALIQNITMIEFPELNSIVVTGSEIGINKFENFIREIDKTVPLVLIEIIIVDIRKSYTLSTGISAGLGSDPNGSASDPTFMPGIDYQLSTESINRLLSSFNGFGWLNIGNVTPDFYLNIQALEDNGVINIRSTPKLATLSGHEATMSSGETRFYKEERSNFIGTQNPTMSNSYTYKSISADLTINIKPIVSGGNQVTLEIDLQQSEFNPSTEGTDAPPGSFTRNFQSIMRVKDQEMVLMGGLERLEGQNSGSGTPILSRIPIIKWIFSTRVKKEGNSKLNIFIKPSIIY